MDGVGDFSVVVYDVTNPGSTMKTSNFEGIFLVSSGGHTVATYS